MFIDKKTIKMDFYNYFIIVNNPNRQNLRLRLQRYLIVLDCLTEALYKRKHHRLQLTHLYVINDLTNFASTQFFHLTYFTPHI